LRLRFPFHVFWNYWIASEWLVNLAEKMGGKIKTQIGVRQAKSLPPQRTIVFLTGWLT
jgi:hypothetical protein